MIQTMSPKEVKRELGRRSEMVRRQEFRETYASFREA
jgi:hypothetical protein